MKIWRPESLPPLPPSPHQSYNPQIQHRVDNRKDTPRDSESRRRRERQHIKAKRE